MARDELTISPSPAAGLAMGDHSLHITALGAHARDQERDISGEGANLRQFPRIGGADHQRAIATAVPAARRQLRHDFVQFAAPGLKIL